MIDCKCGKPVRLGAEHMTLNRKRGVYHYINHMDGTRACGEQWDCVMLKPYPPDPEKPRIKMVARWVAENARTTDQPGESHVE